jgi:hypothetical protein
LRQFLWRVLSFSLLPGVVLVFGEAVLYGSGELWPVDRVLAYQRAHADALYLRAVDQAFYAYKYRGIIQTAPSILVAGSSRTMKFRAEMFGDRAGAFYNAGGLLNSVRDVNDLCETLPSSRTPEVLLLGLDLWWFNAGVPPAYELRSEVDKAGWPTFEQHVLALRWLFTHPSSLAREAVSLTRRSDRNLGINARENGGGFRADGSFRARWPTPRSDAEWRFVDRETPPIIERVRTASANFPPAAAVSPQRLALLDRALTCFDARGVLVVGYLPPFSSEVVAALHSDQRHSRFWLEFTRTMPDVFRAHDFPLVDASELAAFGMDDRAMSDGMHAEETFHVHLLKGLLRDPRVRARVPGAERVLDAALASPSTNYWQPDLGS